MRSAKAVRFEVRKAADRQEDDSKSKRRLRVIGMYIGTDNAYTAFKVFVGIQGLFPHLGIETYALDEVVEGSVYLKIKTWGRNFANKREVKKVASQLRQTAEAMTVEKAQAENASVLLNSVANAAAAIENVDTFTFRSGPLLVAKVTDEDGKAHIRAEALSSAEIAERRIDAATLKNPQLMFEALESQDDEAA